MAAKLNGRPPVQRAAESAPNRTGLPDGLKAGIEQLSGLSLDDVRVHRNSAEPAQLQAAAFAQGTDIHLAPGQEQHLAHEAWHVVQQKQGRVQATAQLHGFTLNDDPGLEREATVQGTIAAGWKSAPDNDTSRPLKSVNIGPVQRAPVQRMTVGYTDADLGHPPAIAPAFADETIQYLVHQRAGIPLATRVAVNGFGDSAPPPVTYKHHVAYDTIYQRLRGVCEGETRDDIVDALGVRCDLVGVDTGTFGVNPLAHVAGFNTWLDLAIVTICDWPNNIFRGASGGGDPDTPTAPTLALTARLNEARDILDDVD
jgi:hypothetical protein